MITAVDTSVLLDVFGASPLFGQGSAQALRRCLNEGALVACEAVWAETRVAFADRSRFELAIFRQVVSVGSDLFDVTTVH